MTRNVHHMDAAEKPKQGNPYTISDEEWEKHRLRLEPVEPELIFRIECCDGQETPMPPLVKPGQGRTDLDDEICIASFCAGAAVMFLAILMVWGVMQ